MADWVDGLASGGFVYDAVSDCVVELGVGEDAMAKVVGEDEV